MGQLGGNDTSTYFVALILPCSSTEPQGDWEEKTDPKQHDNTLQHKTCLYSLYNGKYFGTIGDTTPNSIIESGSWSFKPVGHHL